MSLFLMFAADICAYLVKGMCGFGNTLVFSTIMSFAASNVNISPLELLVGFPSNIALACQNRKGLSTKIWLPLSLMVMLGCLPGAIFLKLGDVRVIKVIFGFVVVALALEMFLRERSNQKKKPNPILMGAIGVCSGVMCGLFGIGVLLAAYVGRLTDDTQTFKANLGIVFCVENVFRLIVYCVSGILTFAILKRALILLPFMAIGLFIGMKLSSIVSEKIVKLSVILLLALSGVALIAQNFAVL
ncbi:MAG: sulfite exporter TauE/SafE family protein [Oscillospiraceae bacterium]|nr:sulfite exporter TauE/SafE family protein [Oscillospiraceae bacterium]